MQYILIQFQDDGAQAYQETFAGNVLRVTGLNGLTLDGVQQRPAQVIDPNPPQPSWALPDPPAPVPAPVSTIVSKLQYLNAFTEAELETIYAAADASVHIRVWLAKFNLAEYIDVADPINRDGLTALETGGLLGTGRASQILQTLGAPPC